MSETVRDDEHLLWQVAFVEGIFLVVAVAIIYVRDSMGTVVYRLPLITEVTIGLPVGAALGALVGFGLLRSPLRRHVVEGVLPLRPLTSAVWSIVGAGLLAGFCEELLFRAALQEWIGLFWASILFGFAHSGTARVHKGVGLGKLAYLLSTVVAGVLLGFMYQRVGLMASMSAHAAFDIAILLVLAPAIATAAGGARVEAAAGVEASRPRTAG